LAKSARLRDRKPWLGRARVALGVTGIRPLAGINSAGAVARGGARDRKSSARDGLERIAVGGSGGACPPHFAHGSFE
jgi:hypothetical protein